MTTAFAPVLDRELVARLSGFLRDASFTAADIQKLLGTEGELLARPRELPVQLKRLEGAQEPLASLAMLFVLGGSLDESETDERLRPFGIEPFLELRLVEHDGNDVRGAIRIIPHDHLLIASDRASNEAGPDHVAGVHRPSAGLAHLTVRCPVDRALDVGTGNGVQALLAAAHSERVVATDVNERALAFAEFNAALNRIENVEFRSGNFFEPVAGERFGLVVCNPPYVVSPENEYLFRDSGLQGDTVSELVATELPAALEEGGFGTMTASWIQSDDDASERPRAWLDGSGCDAWIVHTSVDDPLETAAAWNRDSPADELEDRLERWLDYYREQGIDAVSYGAFVVRRRSNAQNWIRSSAVPRSGINNAGPHLERLFAAQDFLASADELLTRRFRFHEGVRLEHALSPAEDGWNLVDAELVLTDGLPFRAGLDSATSAVVRRLDPNRPLEDILAEAAASLGVDAGRFRAAGVEFVKQLLELGYVVPA